METKKEITQEQIDKWKQQYGAVFEITVEDKKAYLKPPDRKILSCATVEAGKDPFAFNDIILKNCWIGGDEEIRDVESYSLAAGSQLDKIIEFREASIKKL